MKKFLVGLLTVALAASMLVGCGKKEEKKKADNSLKDVQSKKELVLGLDSSEKSIPRCILRLKR